MQSPQMPVATGESAAIRRAELDKIIVGRLLQPRYQPLVDFRGRRVLAAEALVFAPQSPLFPDAHALFGAAESVGCLARLELACLDVALAGAARARLADRIFLNLSPTAVLSDIDWPEVLESLCRRHRIEPAACVLELTERSLVEDFGRIHRTLDAVRELGLDIAIDDLGAGYSGLRLWSELRPEFVKIDRYFVSGIDRDGVKLEFVRSIVAMARAVGSYVIAEGVETPAECRALFELEVDGAQGYLFGRPAAELPAERSVLAPLETLAPLEPASTIEHLALAEPAIAPTMRIRDFVQLLRQQTERDAFPIVSAEGVPLGMIWRNAFLLRYARPLQPEVLDRRPVSEVMDPEPLFVDARLRLEQVSQLITRRPHRQRTEQFIIVRDGRYLGIGRSVQLLEHLTQERVRVATHSNPLTLLPGNVPITENLARLIAQGRSCVVGYVDLDNFKPFNDVYGYLKGDQVLRHLAQLLQSVVARATDFVGHIGGDDFIVIMRSTDWAARLERLAHEFEASVRLFYSEEHRLVGGIDAVDRYGQRRWFGFLTLSVAVIDTALHPARSAEEASERLQELKRIAKARHGSCIIEQRAEGIVDLLHRPYVDTTPDLALSARIGGGVG